MNMRIEFLEIQIHTLLSIHGVILGLFLYIFTDYTVARGES